MVLVAVQPMCVHVPRNSKRLTVAVHNRHQSAYSVHCYAVPYPEMVIVQHVARGAPVCRCALLGDAARLDMRRGLVVVAGFGGCKLCDCVEDRIGFQLNGTGGCWKGH